MTRNGVVNLICGWWNDFRADLEVTEPNLLNIQLNKLYLEHIEHLGHANRKVRVKVFTTRERKFGDRQWNEEDDAWELAVTGDSLSPCVFQFPLVKPVPWSDSEEARAGGDWKVKSSGLASDPTNNQMAVCIWSEDDICTLPFYDKDLLVFQVVAVEVGGGDENKICEVKLPLEQKGGVVTPVTGLPREALNEINGLPIDGRKAFAWTSYTSVEGDSPQGANMLWWNDRMFPEKYTKRGNIRFKYKVEKRFNIKLRNFVKWFSLMPVIYPWLLPVIKWFQSDICGISPETHLANYSFVHECKGYPRCEGSVVGMSVSDFIAEAPATGAMAATFTWSFFKLYEISSAVPKGSERFIFFVVSFLAFLMAPVTKYGPLHAITTLFFCSGAIAYYYGLLNLFNADHEFSSCYCPCIGQRFVFVRFVLRSCIAALICVVILQGLGFFFGIFFPDANPILKYVPWLFYVCESLGLSFAALFPVRWHIEQGIARRQLERRRADNNTANGASTESSSGPPQVVPSGPPQDVPIPIVDEMTVTLSRQVVEELKQALNNANRDDLRAPLRPEEP